MLPSSSLQELLVGQILKLYPGKRQAVKELGRLLGLKDDAIYRRINNERRLSIDELEVLSRHYNIDLNALVGTSPGKMSFYFNHFQAPVRSYFDYLKRLEATFSKIISYKDVKIYYATQDIPLFLYMQWPELTAFKLYIHGLINWSFDYLKERPFSFELTPFTELEIGRNIAVRYNYLNSIELWSPNILDHTINHVRFVANSGRFKHKEDAFEICHLLKELVRVAEQQAIRGSKNRDREYSGNLQLYYNELASMGNTILVAGENQQILFTSFVAPNYLVTEDAALCKYTEEWFNTFKHRAAYLSMHTGEASGRFFSSLKQKVEDLRLYLEQVMR
jgi:hypothetical protein